MLKPKPDDSESLWYCVGPSIPRWFDSQWFTIVAGKSGGQDKGRADVLLTLQRPVKRKLTLHRPGLLGSDHSYGEAVAKRQGV